MLDWILAGMGVEFFVLRAWLIARGEGAWTVPLFFFLLSGVLLMLSLRFVLSGSPAPWLEVILGLSCVTHLLFLFRAKMLIFSSASSGASRDGELS